MKKKLITHCLLWIVFLDWLSSKSRVSHLMYYLTHRHRMGKNGFMPFTRVQLELELIQFSLYANECYKHFQEQLYGHGWGEKERKFYMHEVKLLVSHRNISSVCSFFFLPISNFCFEFTVVLLYWLPPKSIARY